MVGYVTGYVVRENAKQGQTCGAMYCGQYGHHFVPSFVHIVETILLRVKRR